ncbi:MAG TPA: hypothetical protein PKU78_06010 [Candidatus Dojkabacteria bacterium]|nr:hypothetical protein [Candidatus Dojkabacteria bacterium]HRO65750.1 hypothetical protein [Candidatus Dojkabacteria bacterium]HRP51841.1 hypothetical protein [Candidatus Dojkabacteria bacterium]
MIANKEFPKKEDDFGSDAENIIIPKDVVDFLEDLALTNRPDEGAKKMGALDDEGSED